MQDTSLATLILLGILEGLTEFLPVSSTGHLILAGTLLGFEGEASTTFKVSIQLGAILAVLVTYRRRFADVLSGLGRGSRGARAFARNIILGFLPAMAIGVLAYEGIRQLMTSPMVVAAVLVLGGVAILLLERLVKEVRFESVEDIPTSTALVIGLVQCLAMVPGVSRSGATIIGALFMGVERKAAAEFSFFLAVPTMIAATGYDLFQRRASLSAADLEGIAIGFSAAFLTAMLVVRAFVAIVSRYGFAPFAWYRIIAGTCAFIWLAG